MGSGPVFIDLTSSSDDEDDDLTVLSGGKKGQTQRPVKRSHSAIGAGNGSAGKAGKLNKTTRNEFSQKSSQDSNWIDDDCCMLDSDPSRVDTPIKTVNHDTGEEDLMIIASTTVVACRDYPHSRHTCVQYPFKSTSHEKYCPQCHCYVCELRAPCPLWGLGNKTSDHCHASDKADEKWTFLRKFSKTVAPARKTSVPRLVPSHAPPARPVSTSSAGGGNAYGSCRPVVYNPTVSNGSSTEMSADSLEDSWINTSLGLGNQLAANERDEHVQDSSTRSAVHGAHSESDGHALPLKYRKRLAGAFLPAASTKPTHIGPRTGGRGSPTPGRHPPLQIRLNRPDGRHHQQKSSRMSAGNSYRDPDPPRKSSKRYVQQSRSSHPQVVDDRQREPNFISGRCESSVNFTDTTSLSSYLGLDYCLLDLSEPFEAIHAESLPPLQSSRSAHHQTSHSDLNPVPDREVVNLAEPCTSRIDTSLLSHPPLDEPSPALCSRPDLVPSTLEETKQQPHVGAQATSRYQGSDSLVSFAAILDAEDEVCHYTGTDFFDQYASSNSLYAPRGQDRPNCTGGWLYDSTDNSNEVHSRPGSLPTDCSREWSEKTDLDPPTPQPSFSNGRREWEQTNAVGVPSRNTDELGLPIADYVLDGSNFWGHLE